MEISEQMLFAIVGKKAVELELCQQELARLKQLYEDSQNTVEELQQRIRSMMNGS